MPRPSNDHDRDDIDLNDPAEQGRYGDRDLPPGDRPNRVVEIDLDDLGPEDDRQSER